MIDLFMPFRAFLKLDHVCIDNNVFRMHYKVTVIMLLVFTLLVTSKQFFGDPIHCIGDSDSDKDAINSYCWIYGTYTLKSRLAVSTFMRSHWLLGKGMLIVLGMLFVFLYTMMVENKHTPYLMVDGMEGSHMSYVGVGPESGSKEDRIEHAYYQWVCFVLLGQSVMFYTPRYLWKIWEGGRLKALASDLASPVVTKDWPEYRRGELVTYLAYSNMYSHNMYALRYAFCEILNLVNVVGQMFLLDIFLGGAFRNYGAAVATFTHVPRVPPDMTDFASVNPMDQYFPKITKCFIRQYGPSGTLQYRDRMCILPLNIVNEKIFVIIWFWFIFLTFVSVLAVLFRVLVLSARPLRVVMTMGHLRNVKRSTVSRIVRRFGFGDWFILYLLGKNVNPRIYKELILELSKEMEQQNYPMI